MLRFRPKPGPGVDRAAEWRCCLCLHVRTATVLLGIWHLLLHLVALGFLAAIMREPRLLGELDRELSAGPEWGEGGALPTPLSNVELSSSESNAYTQNVSRDHSLLYHDVDMGALVTVCTLAITLMLIYGAARGKPGHLLPFFCLQLFDFAITVLTATGYLCYLRSIHHLVSETRRVPWRGALLSLPAPALALLVMCAFLGAVLLKAYCISVVWRCYKFLTMRAHALQSLTPFVISGESLVAGGAPAGPAPTYPAPDYSTLLPDYEEAVKQTPPPSYRLAVMMSADSALSSPDESGDAAPLPVSSPAPAVAAAATPAATPAAATPATPAAPAPSAASTVVVVAHEAANHARV